MSLGDRVADIFKALSNLGTNAERVNLEAKIKKFSDVKAWKEHNISLVIATGGLSGIAGGPVGLAAIPVDLAWCGRVGVHGSIGIGYILGRNVDYEEDMNLILAIWGGLGDAAMTVPAGKVGIKVGGKIAAKSVSLVAGTVVSKFVLKGGSKVGAKLASKAASKAATKFMAKLTAKTGLAWIPLIGGVVSAGVNWWLVDGLMSAAEQYYRNDYVILNDEELADDL
jgi:hypothetical protein